MTVSAATLVRDARMARQLTMAALASLAGVPTSTISRIEAGKIEPTVTMLTRITGAAGFVFTPNLIEAGSDQPFSDALDQLDRATGEEQIRAFERLAAVSSVAPVARRAGVRRVAVPNNLPTALGLLEAQGQDPVASGMEAVFESVEPTHSFIPLVYVDDPSTVDGFDPAGRHAFQVMFLLPTTGNVRRWTRPVGGQLMMSKEWGLLDAMASPGRQGDIAREVFETMKMVPA